MNDTDLVDDVSPDDLTLIERYRDGRDDAVALLWQRHFKPLTGWARRMTSRFDAEDLASEAFTLMLQALRNGHGPTSHVSSYLRATVRNLSMAWTAHELPLDHDADLDVIIGENEGPEARVDSLSDSAAKSAFRALPLRWQRVLWLTEFEAVSRGELAQTFGIDANAARVLRWRAVQGLRREFERELAQRSA